MLLPFFFQKKGRLFTENKLQKHSVLSFFFLFLIAAYFTVLYYA